MRLSENCCCGCSDEAGVDLGVTYFIETLWRREGHFALTVVLLFIERESVRGLKNGSYPALIGSFNIVRVALVLWEARVRLLGLMVALCNLNLSFL